jgi:predicted CxxxxCH...CXXCH cytochrome family protein
MNWGTDRSTLDNCTICHGNPTTGDNATVAPYKRAPGADAVGVDTAGHNAATDKQVGAHAAHLGTALGKTAAGYSAAVACSNCHRVPTSVTTLGHNDSALPAEVSFINSTLALLNGSTPSYNYTTGRCTNVYCHGANMPNGDGPVITSATVTWSDPGYLSTGPTTTNGDCDKCHNSPPASHNQGLLIGNCNGCHDHVAVNGTFADATKHINGTLEMQVGCTNCHATAQGSAPVRRAVMSEFGSTWGHMKSGRGQVTDADCCVCHMEGNASDGSINTSYHGASVGDGKIDLRDPDLGTAINLGADYQFSRDLGSNVIESNVTTIQNFCLKCHDANGANHTSARVTGGTATNPWNDGATILNVDAHFATTNASFHPVKGVQNGAYAASANTMEIPWNTTTHKLITCFDCHAGSNATGVQASTVVAHGGGVTLRKPYDKVAGAATQLCVVCHKSTVYWTTTAHKLATGFSAFNATNNDATFANSGYHGAGSTYNSGCTVCHGTGLYSAALPARPAGAENAHGFDTTGTGASTWSASSLAGGQATRPYAFMRNTDDFGFWNIGTGTGTAKGLCENMCGGSRDYTYGPTGTY